MAAFCEGKAGGFDWRSLQDALRRRAYPAVTHHTHSLEALPRPETEAIIVLFPF